MAPPTRRSQAERRAASEEAMLQAAAELIVERGIEKTSLRSIGERAGTSREMPAYHFGSKDNLVGRLATRGHERTIAAALETLDRHEDVDPDALTKLESLRLIIESYLEVVTEAETPEERAVVVMWGATFPTDSRLPVLADSDRATHEELAQHIRDGQDDGSVRLDVDPGAAATMIMGMARGVAAFSFTYPDLTATAALRQACGQTIVRGLARDA